ncbi:hypothetical protein [Acidisphaera rubrifaciens]|uniref:hypothetical protein n=1 Tax=Acidisphaera rubrifaciens TaxID=50715 RepID=UPI0011DC8DF1|nr:hypothetical protein [Acidisphaera rubrifaciens]
MYRLLFVFAAIGLLAHQALADEDFRILAESGGWAASAHSSSELAPPDVCLVINFGTGIAFRTDMDGTQLRVLDKSWSLPADAEGTMSVDIGALHKSFPTRTATNDMVAATLTADEIVELLQAMDHTTKMVLTVGNTRPRTVSLVGSTKATNAYRTCAGLPGSAAGGGVNPFAPPSTTSGRSSEPEK